jgi:hypothetical protein
MVTGARIAALREHTDLGWLTALRAPQVAALAADDGPLQLSLFDEVGLAEIAHPDFPGERLIACRNPRWPPNAPASAPRCSRPPRPTWPRSRRRWRPGGWWTPPRSGCGSGG